MLKRLAAMCVALLVFAAVPNAGAVSEEDVRRAADDLAAARAAASSAVADLNTARREADDVRDRLEGLISRMVEADAHLADATVVVRMRAGELYMAAGADHSVLVLGPDSGVRFVYANAVYASARESVVVLEAAGKDLERVRSIVESEVERAGVAAVRLETAAATADAIVGDAERRYATLFAEWEAERAAIARAEAAAASAAAAAATSTTSTTTTTTTASTGTTTVSSTTTTIPGGTTTTTTQPEPVGGGTFRPDVERWRPLVGEYFRNRHVEQALSVMQCESGGDPKITNTSSGAAGLFQHIPRYWPERARAIGMPNASPYDAEANIAASAWLVQVSLDLDLDAWYFWSCKP
ncbi:transglycosylase SLT domain-containing protein [bacterium]|nr:transglycosylase SLT domain-containing protein [bacterium]